MTSHGALACWCVAVVVVLGTLHGLGTGEMATPPLPWHWGTWLESVDAAAALVAIARVVALVCAWYLAAITALGLGLQVVSGRGSPSVERLVPRVLRPLLASAIGLSVVITPVLGHARPAAAAGSHSSDEGTADEGGPAEPRHPLATDGAPTTGTTETPTPRDPSRPLHADGAPAAVTMSRLALELAPMPVPLEADDVWTVRTGDHFWSIATETLADRWNLEPSNAEIDQYWRVLVEANRHVLAVPSNPDLLYPGQVLDLPEPLGPVAP